MAHATGSARTAVSRSRSSTGWHLPAGATTYSAKPPGSVTPSARRWRQNAGRPAPAVIAQPAREHVVEGHHLTGHDLDYPLPEEVDLPDDLVPRDKGVYREELSVVQVDVRAAHPRDEDAQTDLPGAGDGVGDLRQTKLAGLVVYDSVQGRLPVVVKPSRAGRSLSARSRPGSGAKRSRSRPAGRVRPGACRLGPGRRPGHAGPAEAMPD